MQKRVSGSSDLWCVLYEGTPSGCKHAAVCCNTLTISKYITTDPNIMGGAPVIRGTRVPIEVLLYCLKERYTLEELHKHYPWVYQKTFARAIDEIIQLVNTTSTKSAL